MVRRPLNATWYHCTASAGNADSIRMRGSVAWVSAIAMQGVRCVSQSDEQAPTLYFGSILLNIGAFFSMSGMMTNLHGVHVALDMSRSQGMMHVHSFCPESQLHSAATDALMMTFRDTLLHDNLTCLWPMAKDQTCIAG